MGMSGTFQRVWQVIKEFSADTVEHGPLDEDGVFKVNESWQATARRRRIEIMVTGDPTRVSAAVDAIDTAQNYILGGQSKQKFETRVTAFLDNCIHRTKWSSKPFKTGIKARRLHCEQSRTKFADALADSRGEMVDDIILIGHRFDDDINEAITQAEQLKEQGVQIYCFHTGADLESRKAYEELANKTGGVFSQLTDQSCLNQVMPILMAYLNDQDICESLASSPDEQALLQKLKLLALQSPKAKEKV